MVKTAKPDTSWMTDAECRIRGMSAQKFYIDDENGEPPAVCANCLVKDACLEYAIVNREREGFWGGTNQRQRRSITRQRRNQRRQVG